MASHLFLLISSFIDKFMHQNGDQANISDAWCPGNPVINNYVALGMTGKLTLLHKGILLRPVICVRKYNG